MSNEKSVPALIATFSFDLASGKADSFANSLEQSIALTPSDPDGDCRSCTLDKPHLFTFQIPSALDSAAVQIILNGTGGTPEAWRSVRGLL